MSDSDSYDEENDDFESRTEFFKRWPKLKQVFKVLFENQYRDVDYTEDLEVKGNLREEIEAELKDVGPDDIPKKRFRRSFISFLKEKIQEAEYERQRRFPYMLFDELMSYFMDNSKSSLPIKYYALRGFKELRQKHLSEMHTDYPETEECSVKWFEDEMTLISAFFHQEQMTLSCIVSSGLDDLAEQVRDLLTEKHPSNALLRLPQIVLKSYHFKGFAENRYSDKTTREILDCQCELFKKLGFQVVNEYDKDLMDIYEALETKKGNWPVIYAIFMGVAHRLGVRCRLLNIDGHQTPVLGWKSLPDDDDSESEEEAKKAKKVTIAKFFALNIFECTKSQHEEVSCSEEQIEEVFQFVVIYDRIPRVVYGELRADLLGIIDHELIALHKYQLKDSSDEDERCGQNNRSEAYYGFSSDEEYVNEYDSPDSCDDSWGCGFGGSGSSNKKRKKRSNKIAVSKSKLMDKLTAISKRSQAFETRQQLREMEKLNKKLKKKNDTLKSQVSSKENEAEKKE